MILFYMPCYMRLRHFVSSALAFAPGVTASLLINPQNSEIELQDQYSTNSFDLSSPLKPLILAFRRAQERPNVARNGYRIPSVHGTLPYASSLKTPKLNCKTNTQPIFMI